MISRYTWQKSVKTHLKFETTYRISQWHLN